MENNNDTFEFLDRRLINFYNFINVDYYDYLDYKLEETIELFCNLNCLDVESKIQYISKNYTYIKNTLNYSFNDFLVVYKEILNSTKQINSMDKLLMFINNYNTIIIDNNIEKMHVTLFELYLNIIINNDISNNLILYNVAYNNLYSILSKYIKDYHSNNNISDICINIFIFCIIMNMRYGTCGYEEKILSNILRDISYFLCDVQNFIKLSESIPIIDNKFLILYTNCYIKPSDRENFNLLYKDQFGFISKLFNTSKINSLEYNTLYYMNEHNELNKIYSNKSSLIKYTKHIRDRIFYPLFSNKSVKGIIKIRSSDIKMENINEVMVLPYMIKIKDNYFYGNNNYTVLILV